MIEFKEVNGRLYMVIKDAMLLSRPYRNFEGRPNDYNPAGGSREFGVVIDDPELAQELAGDNWNIKTITNRDGREYLYGVKADGRDLNWMPVKVKYKKLDGKPTIPPKIEIKTTNNVLFYEEDNVKELDNADLMDVSLLINPSRKVTNGKPYTTAYLNRMRATLLDDSFFFDNKDDDMPFDVD